jgi:hypothetical protein
MRVSPANFEIVENPALDALGLKFSPGGTHFSRTMMLKELAQALAGVPPHGTLADYAQAIVNRNLLGKATESTRRKSFRHLQELYGMDRSIPLFSILRILTEQSPSALPPLALLVAWSRDPTLRLTTEVVLGRPEGQPISSQEIADSLSAACEKEYSALSLHRIARNSASSWTQSGHLVGATKKVRRRVNAPLAAVTLALFLGKHAGFAGASIFQNPWCRLLDLNESTARELAMEANRAGLLHLLSVGEVVEVRFPLFAEIERHLP